MFATKEKFEKQIIKDNATINLIDVSVNEVFRQLAEKLKEYSKHSKQKTQT
jgi:stalled ribosome alternative rescue factor ArfA